MEAVGETTLRVNNLFAGLGKRIMISLEIIGYARAAAQLAHHGYHEEAKKCMAEAAKLKTH